MLSYGLQQRNQLAGLDLLTRSSTLYAAAGVTIALASIGLPAWRTHGKTASSSELPPAARKWTLKYPKARIFPCRTAHARIFPKKHTFSYSYLQCGFPIVPDTTTAGGIDVSSGNDCELGSWWLRVKADDYLDRGNGKLGFYEKLKMYLRKHVSTKR